MSDSIERANELVNNTIRANAQLVQKRNEVMALNGVYRQQLHHQGRSIKRLRNRSKGYRENIAGLRARVAELQHHLEAMREENERLKTRVNHYELLAQAKNDDPPAKPLWRPGTPKLTDKQIKEISKRMLLGEHAVDMADEYGVTATTIYSRTKSVREAMLRKAAASS